MTEHYLGRVSPFGDPWISARSGSPRHFVACHVLHRLLAPRHPPRALCSLTSLSSLPIGKCGGTIGVHHLVISTAKSKLFDLLPITSSLGKVRAPLRAVRLIGGPRSSDPLVGDLELARSRALIRGSMLLSRFVSDGPVRRQHGSGGDEETRTPDPLLAKEMLFQLSYVPADDDEAREWWAFLDSNQRPLPYQGSALTS